MVMEDAGFAGVFRIDVEDTKDSTRVDAFLHRVLRRLSRR
jgi:hypothetical protein